MDYIDSTGDGFLENSYFACSDSDGFNDMLKMLIIEKNALYDPPVSDRRHHYSDSSDIPDGTARGRKHKWLYQEDEWIS